jgi:GTPase SAR1 family protein
MKAILVGESGVGKSNIIYRYCDNKYSPHLPATCFEPSVKRIILNYRDIKYLINK